MEIKNDKKFILAALGVITLILVVVGATYAYFTAQGGSAVNTNVNVTTNTTDNLSFQVGNPISITANQEDFAQNAGNKTGSTTASATLTSNNATNNATKNYYLYLDIENNTFTYTTDNDTAELILTIENPDGTQVETLPGYDYVTVGSVSGFDITKADRLIAIADNYEIESHGTKTQTWDVTITFVNLDSNQNVNAGKEFNATLIMQEGKIERNYFSDYIVSTYTDGSNGLYYHDENLANGAQDNSYRYSGANPNNYVCFGATGADCQNAENQYRIIGVFNNQVKLIKSTSYGRYVWEQDYSTQGNTWDETTKPDIYTTLNTTYFGTLSNEWQRLIDQSHTWQVGGMTSSNGMSVAKTVYDYEVGINQTGYEETMAIGLMYVSDYGYGAGPSKWTTALGTSNYGTDNWLYLGSSEWLISGLADASLGVFCVASYHGGILEYSYVSNPIAIHPAFYLSSSIELSVGTGTTSDPYILKIN